MITGYHQNSINQCSTNIIFAFETINTTSRKEREHMHLFISHTSKDNEILNQIIKILDKYHIDSRWIDIEKIKDNSRIRKEITDGILNCTHFLLLWSKNAAESEWVKEEINAVSSDPYDKKIKKIILKVDNTPLLPLLADAYFRTYSDPEKDVLDIIQEHTGNFITQVKIFKKTVQEHYRNPPKEPQKPIIGNFKKFNGYKLYVQQNYEVREYDPISKNIANYVLQLIDTNLKNKKIEEDTIKLLNAEIDTLKKVKSGKPTKENKKLEEKVLNKIKNLKYKQERIRSERVIAIVGDYGSGKSALCHFVLYKLCELESDEIIPIFVPLGSLPKETDTNRDLILDIYEYIKKEYKFNISFNEFSDYVSNGKIIFILDALDERSTKLEDTIAQNNLDLILKLGEKNIVLLTSRHTYLTTNMEEKLLFDYKKIIKIKDFTKDEIESFIHRIIGNEEKKKDEIEKVLQDEKVKELAQKPLFLHVICENFNKIKDYFVINESVILKILTEKWIIHDIKKNVLEAKKECELIDERQRISEILAFAQYRTGELISIQHIQSEVTNEFKDSDADAKNRLERYYRDARDSTFLTREENEKFRFILNPVMEYFVARRIVNDIRNCKSKSLLEHVTLIKTQETFDFISGIIDIEWAVKPHVFQEISEENPDRAILETKKNLRNSFYSIIHEIRAEKPNQNLKNFIKILHMTHNLPIRPRLSRFNLAEIQIPTADLRGADLSYANLNGANLIGADLRGANLTGAKMHSAVLIGSNLMGASLFGAELYKANLTGCDLSNTDLRDAKMNEAKIHGAILDHARTRDNRYQIYLSKCDLTRSSVQGIDLSYVDLADTKFIDVDLRSVNVIGSRFHKADLSRANFTGAELTDTDFRGADLYRTNFSRTKMNKTKFSGAEILRTDFNGVDLDRIDVRGVDLRGANNLTASRNQLRERGATI